MLLCLSCVSFVIFLHTLFISLSGFATFPENEMRMDNEIEIILHLSRILFSRMLSLLYREPGI